MVGRNKTPFDYSIYFMKCGNAILKHGSARPQPILQLSCGHSNEIIEERNRGIETAKMLANCIRKNDSEHARYIGNDKPGTGSGKYSIRYLLYRYWRIQYQLNGLRRS